MYRAARSALHLRRGKANRPLGKQQNRNLEDVPSQGYTGCAGIWGRIGAEARLIVLSASCTGRASELL
jgi:hypothetical protein